MKIKLLLVQFFCIIIRVTNTSNVASNSSQDINIFFDIRKDPQNPWSYTDAERTRRFFHLVQQNTNLIKNPQRVLSYGCSSGMEVLYLRKLYPNATIIGTDIKFKEPKQQCELWKLAETCCKPDENIRYIPLDELQKKENQSFHFITCNMVFFKYIHLTEFEFVMHFFMKLLHPTMKSMGMLTAYLRNGWSYSDFDHDIVIQFMNKNKVYKDKMIFIRYANFFQFLFSPTYNITFKSDFKNKAL